MKNVLRDSVISVVRQLIAFALGGFVTWASAHGLQITGQIELIVGVAAVFIVNVLWTIVSHLLQKWKVNAALLLEPNATHAQLDAVVSAVPVLTQIAQSLTIPEHEHGQLATPIEAQK